jgi:hypothetical protein
MRTLIFLFLVLFSANAFCQTFQKAIYKHANDVYAGQGISNRYLFSDSVGTTKWHHSISIEGQLHNNYIYHSSSSKVVLFKNKVQGDTTNIFKIQFHYRLLFNIQKNKNNFGVGLGFTQPLHLTKYSDNSLSEYRYNILEMPIIMSYSLFKGYIISKFHFGISPGLVLNQITKFYQPNESKPSELNKLDLNKFCFIMEGGFDFEFVLNKRISLFSKIIARSNLVSFYRPYTIGGYWVHFSSFNFGIGLKYNFN